jgi:hypothetical protein
VTSPVTAGIDLVAAARGYLALQPELYSVLGSSQDWDIWLFQEKSYVRVESSQQTACVLKQMGSWTSPNSWNHMRFPRLQVEFWADPDRDEKANNAEPLSAKDKILAAHNVIDNFLHFTMLSEQWWPEISATAPMRILNSTRQGELEFAEVPDGDGLMRAIVFYAIGVG